MSELEHQKQFFSKTTEKAEAKRKEDSATVAIVRSLFTQFVVTENISFMAMDNPILERIFEILGQQSACLPERHWISTHSRTLFQIVAENSRKEMATWGEVGGFADTDAWSNFKTSFQVVIGHHMDANFKLKSVPLRLLLLQGVDAHKGKNIAKQIRPVLEESGADFFGGCSDAAANAQAANKALLATLPTFSGYTICCAHWLHNLFGSVVAPTNAQKLSAEDFVKIMSHFLPDFTGNWTNNCEVDSCF